MVRCIVIVSVVALAACGKRGDDPPPPRAPEPPVVAPAPAKPASAAASDAKAVAPAENLSGLVGKLREEGAHRPSGGIPTERVLDALDAAGLRMTERQQVLAVVARASYCVSARDGQVALSICEYPTHEAAVAGEQATKKAFPMIRAMRAIRAGTLVTVIYNEATVDRAKQVIDVVSKLEARSNGGNG